MSYYIGGSPQDVLNSIAKRYFYGMRRNEDGELFLAKADQLRQGVANSIVINEPGAAVDNLNTFDEGVDYVDGINEDHEFVKNNLRYPQLKWDTRDVLYYVDDEGQLVIRVAENYEYPDGVSGPGY